MGVVTITGGAGNLGRAVARVLVERGYHVRLFDLPEADWSFAEDTPDKTPPTLQVIRGDLRDRAAVAEACSESDWILHLAAIMPPLSEANHELTEAVNVQGTRTLLEVMSSQARLVFASSVATYGVAQTETVSIEHPQQPIDFYGKTKVQNEHDILVSGRTAVILRISGISVPALLEPPRPWFFTRDQKVEFVHLHDAALVVANCIGNEKVLRHIWQIAGGQSWRTTGQGYAEAVCQAFDIPPESVAYLDAPNWPAWYDTRESQAVLKYQCHTFEDFINQLRAIYHAAIG